MKILLLFLSVVCAVQANYIIQVKQEVGEGGCGNDKEGGTGDGGEEGEEGEGEGGGDGGGSGSTELQNHLNDLQTRLEIAEEIAFIIDDLLNKIPDFLNALNNAGEFEEPCGAPDEPPCPPNRHRRSVVNFDNCDPSIDLNGDLGNVIVAVINGLLNAMPALVASQESTMFKCYLTTLYSIESDLKSGSLNKPGFIDAITASASLLAIIAEQQQNLADEVIVTIKADIADIRTQIAEKEAGIEEAESSDDE